MTIYGIERLHLEFKLWDEIFNTSCKTVITNIKAYNNCTNSIKMFIKFNNEYYFKFKKQWKILNV